MRKILLIIIALFANSAFASPPSEGFADIVEPLMPAVVNINTVKYAKKKQRKLLPPENFQIDQFNELFEQFGMPFFMDEMPSNPKATSLGSGFIIDPEGYIVTNHHVIKEADEITVRLNDNSEYPAKLVGSDQKTDIAVLKINSKTPFPFVRFGDSSNSRVGDWIIAIGNPFGLGGTVTAGIISSKSRDIDIISEGIIDDYIQTDAAINGGNSGGPMFNMNGEVIGVNTAILTPSGTNIGISFAIPSNNVSNVIKQLKANGKIERGKLGIKVQDITPELAEGLELKNVEGALLAGVEPNGSGAKAGLKEGDIITEYNGVPVKSVRKLLILVAETPLNKEIKIKVLREGKTLSLSAFVKEIKDEVIANSVKEAVQEDVYKGYIVNGVKFVDITKQLSSSLNIEEQEGVLVLSNSSKDAWRNLVKGDVVKAINQVPVNKLEDFKTLYESSKKAGKKNIVFLVKRNAMTIFLAIPLV